MPVNFFSQLIALCLEIIPIKFNRILFKDYHASMVFACYYFIGYHDNDGHFENGLPDSTFTDHMQPSREGSYSLSQWYLRTDVDKFMD